MSDFNEAIRTAALAAVEQIRIHRDKVILSSWDNSSSRLLNMLLREGIVSQKQIVKRVNACLLSTGRHCYKLHRQLKIPLDITISPEAAAYAIACGEFSWFEKRKMCFEARSSLDDFMQKHSRKDLLEYIFRQLVIETSPGEIEMPHDPDECLSCP